MMRRLSSGLLALVAGLAIVAGPATGCSSPQAPEEPAPAETSTSAPSGDFLYVASQSGPAVTVIDMSSREIIETIWLTELGYTPNAKPHHVAVEPDGLHWYVSLIVDGWILKFDRNNEIVGRAEFETPGMLALDPRGDVLYVGRSMAAVNPPQRIGVVTRADMEIEEYDVFFPRPHAIASDTGGGRLYTASLAVNQIASLAPEEDDLEVVNVPGDTHTFVQFAISPDGQTLVTGGQVSGQIMVFDLSDPSVPELTETVQVGGEPWHPVYSPDGRFVYFPQRTANSVAVIDAQSWELVASIEGEGIVEPHGSAISADGTVLWISGRNTKGIHGPRDASMRTTDLPGEPQPPGTVVAIDVRSREILAVLQVPAYAAGMATRPAR